MATQAATKRLTKEYLSITANPPPFITAHPSESNILEWHYVLTGPPATPYAAGQYWGTLLFPPEYPFAPPAIRMHTPSGRFQPSTRLCLSISDFHPKSFNPAWEVSTILVGLLSFMTSEEMTTGSVRAGWAERKALAGWSRWWNSTGGGSWRPGAESELEMEMEVEAGKRGVGRDKGGKGKTKGRDGAGSATAGSNSNTRTNNGSIKAGDGGAKFRAEWPDLDAENWRWMKEARIDPLTGTVLSSESETLSSTSRSGDDGTKDAAGQTQSCTPDAATALFSHLPSGAGNVKREAASSSSPSASSSSGQAGQRDDARTWLARNKYAVGAVVLFGYILVARMMEGSGDL